MILPNISAFYLIFPLIIGVFIGLYFGRRHNTKFDGRLIIDQSDYLEKERWSYIFDTTPMDEIEKKDYIVVRIEHIK